MITDEITTTSMDRLLTAVAKFDASDLHLVAGVPPAFRVNGEIILAVEDAGPGIPPESLGRIFEPLFSTKSFGTGLGLPTVKQIVNQHGGIIAVDSKVGRGTCVTVRLPLDAEATPTMREAA